jgi:hypothetical protein
MVSALRTAAKLEPAPSGPTHLVTAKTCLLISAFLLTNCHLAFAQARPARHGVWADGALGGGWVHMSSDTLRGRSQNGIDGIMALGWTFSSRVRAGIGWAQWASGLGVGRQTWINSYDILVYYYPVPDRPFFLEAAVGSVDYAVVHAAGERADSVYFSGSAWGPTVAVGWDASLGSSVSLRPRLSYSYGPPRSLHSADGTLIATGWKQHLLSLDVGFVFHPQDSK